MNISTMMTALKMIRSDIENALDDDEKQVKDRRIRQYVFIEKGIIKRHNLIRLELRYATQLRAIWYGEELAWANINGQKYGEQKLLPEIEHLQQENASLRALLKKTGEVH